MGGEEPRGRSAASSMENPTESGVTAALAGEEDAQPPPPPSLTERGKVRRKALIQVHLGVVERAMAGREDARERGALAEVAAGLRQQEEELDWAVLWRHGRRRTCSKRMTDGRKKEKRNRQI